MALTRRAPVSKHGATCWLCLWSSRFASLLLVWFQWFARPRGLRAAVFRSSWLLAWLGRLVESIRPLRDAFLARLHADGENGELAACKTLACKPAKSRVSGHPKSGNEIWGAKRPKFGENPVRFGQIWSCEVLRDDGRRRELGSPMSGVPGRIRVIHGCAVDHNRPSIRVLGFENGNYGQ